MLDANQQPWWFTTAQFAQCVFAAALLESIYRRGFQGWTEGYEFTRQRDKCFRYLALAVAIWAVAAIAPVLIAFSGVTQKDGTLLSLVRCTLSIVNSRYLLLAFGTLDYSHRVWRYSGSRGWPNFVNVLTSLSLAATAAVAFVPGLLAVPDVVLSVSTLLLFMCGLYASFRERMFPFLPPLTIFAFAIQMLAQVPELCDSNNSLLEQWRLAYPRVNALLSHLMESRWFLLLGSKALVISLYVCLAITWLHELLEHAGDEVRSQMDSLREKDQRIAILDARVRTLASALEQAPKATDLQRHEDQLVALTQQKEALRQLPVAMRLDVHPTAQQRWLIVVEFADRKRREEIHVRKAPFTTMLALAVWHAKEGEHWVRHSDLWNQPSYATMMNHVSNALASLDPREKAKIVESDGEKKRRIGPRIAVTVARDKLRSTFPDLIKKLSESADPSIP